MIIYNITSKIEHSLLEDWVKWMKEEHIPDVLNTGLFNHHRLLRVIGMDDAEGVTYATQFSCDNLAVMQKYEIHFAKALREKTKKRYQDKVVSFRTLMEVIE